MVTNLVSVMMPAYNAERYIGQAIESVLAQSYRHWELLIVEDGSTDRTGEIAIGYDDPRINVVKQENSGEAAARNTALKHMQGQYVAFLDADDLYLDHHLEYTIDYLVTNPQNEGVYVDGYYIDQNGNRLQSLSSRRRGPFEGRVYEEVVRSSNVFGPPICVVLRSEIIQRNELSFDTSIVIGPDWDFFTRISDVANFGYLNEKTCLYRVHQTNITNRIDFQKRALELAKCRKKAIKMENFHTCSLSTRYAVFYDLLVNLLRGYPEQQLNITEWQEFKDLPAKLQAKIYQLMASQMVMRGGERSYIQKWLNNSRKLDPANRRALVLAKIYNINPVLCKLLLQAKTIGQNDPLKASPFADLGS